MPDLSLACPTCGATPSVEPDRYTCPRCGGNLEVRYDYAAIARQWTPTTLRDDPDPTLWRYRPVLPVHTPWQGLPLGGTPLLAAPRLAARLGLRHLHLKDDTRLPSASFKDRASSIALLHARELGHELVVGASTGNAASSTATLAAGLGVRTRIFIPHTAPAAKVAQLLAFGAEVLAVRGTYDDAFDLCLEATRRFGWYNRNTGYNPYTREGKKTVSFEIAEALGWDVPDWVAVPVGDGNILSGVHKGFVELAALGFTDRVPRLLAVQASGSDAVVRALEGDGSIAPVSGETVADSISVSLPRDGAAAVRAVRETGGAAVRVTDEAILAAIPEVARHAGVFGEPAGVTAVAGLATAVRRGLVDPGARVVALVTGNGLKDVASVRRAPVGEVRPIDPDPHALDALA